MSTIDRQKGKIEVEVLPIYFDYVLGKNYPVVILVGGRNSGKSFYMEQQAVMNLNNKKNYKLLVVEDVETNIGEGVKNGIEQRTGEFGLDNFFGSTKVPAEVTHKVTGNKVIFKGYHSEAQQKQVKSLNEITACWYEEGENITYKQFKALRMQLRGGNEEDRQLFITMNPIISDGYINEEFFQKPPDKVCEWFKDGRPKVFERIIKVEIENDSGGTEIVSLVCLVVVTTYKDNKYLTPEQKADIEELKQTDPEMYEMLGEGKFVKPAGTYFKEFTRGIHVIEPHIIPEDHKRYRVFDYGLDMLACYWVSVDNEGRAEVYKELYESDLIVSEAARRIKEVNGNDKIYETIAPPDMRNKQKDTGKSLQELFYENGISLFIASNDRVTGWMNLKEWLKPYDRPNMETGDADKTSDLRIWDNCTNLINSISKIQRDEKNANDCATEPHELTHAPDALRYWTAGRPCPAKPKAQDKQVKLIDKLKPKPKRII
ncbi:MULTISPECIES: PBSX family phage terminase large subunit [unclassified Dehalobacter]|uniref:PBSX family phage terminase large subunit n=1 Tax=unclassified Dehalobacter TaxID=2635733 RepID=UPI00028B2279|nr:MULTISPECIES: PBSX family phage terminase large subunit [unclassified Dehalobacter]AFV02827.1 phage terminase, large subunit, PBSX family [Dehalobacter sp. DCA]AFV05813.1 phage terminase, large subunit, PBSX family [Dehalobacter sp. CF]